ncbi:SLC13 family permease [uncultured Desulfosarcina sp.]|uniref:SLC13 family permease n=1 Tax=uncultured Desulfosarcina sp. TaxID=218289 RepID=UPI0029C81D53|nr:SLC13 family permease [uncultured Desulfosarcina sp.]
MFIIDRKSIRIVFLLVVLLGARVPGADAGTIDALNAENLYVSGRIVNSHGEAIPDVSVTLTVTETDAPVKETILTDESGRYEFKVLFPAGRLQKARILLEARKSAYAPSVRISLLPIRASIDALASSLYLAEANLTLMRVASPALWISGAVLLFVYVMIGFELVHRTLAALTGAALLLGCSYLVGPFYPEFKIISFEIAARAVDLNVILLLFSMMMIVGVCEKTGMFQWLAHRCYRISGGRVPLLAAGLMILTAVTSSLLDNVTTMLLIIPVTIRIARSLGLNPIALMVPEVFASNVGGTATLIGDPPNIMIGSYTGLSFLDFGLNLGPPCLLVMAVSVIYFLLYYARDYRDAGKAFDGNHSEPAIDFTIEDRRLLFFCLVSLAITIALFLLHGMLEMAPGIAALIGATVLLISVGRRVDIVELLETKVEWSSLVFFAALFTVIAAAQESGLIHLIADGVKSVSGDSLIVAVLMILWVSALASAIIDNIPYTATMLPVVAYLTATVPGAQNGVLWWALAMGACLGGNGTLIGASANVVTAGMAEKAGHPISFVKYLRICLPPMILSIAVCTIWILGMEV